MLPTEKKNQRRSGRVSLAEEVLCVSFPYSKKRFDKISRFSRARYNKAKKQWELSLLELEKLKATPIIRCRGD